MFNIAAAAAAATDTSPYPSITAVTMQMTKRAMSFPHPRRGIGAQD
jgi:hypothetical protein